MRTAHLLNIAVLVQIGEFFSENQLLFDWSNFYFYSENNLEL